jgi:hypothetical protein
MRPKKFTVEEVMKLDRILTLPEYLMLSLEEREELRLLKEREYQQQLWEDYQEHIKHQPKKLEQDQITPEKPEATKEIFLRCVWTTDRVQEQMATLPGFQADFTQCPHLDGRFRCRKLFDQSSGTGFLHCEDIQLKRFELPYYKPSEIDLDQAEDS